MEWKKNAWSVEHTHTQHKANTRSCWLSTVEFFKHSRKIMLTNIFSYHFFQIQLCVYCTGKCTVKNAYIRSSKVSNTPHIVYFGVFITGKSNAANAITKEFRWRKMSTILLGSHRCWITGAHCTLWVRAQNGCGCKSIDEFIWSYPEVPALQALFFVFSCQRQKRKNNRGCWRLSSSEKWLIRWHTTP